MQDSDLVGKGRMHRSYFPKRGGDNAALWVKGAGCRVHGRHKGVSLEMEVGAGQGLPGSLSHVRAHRVLVRSSALS